MLAELRLQSTLTREIASNLAGLNNIAYIGVVQTIGAVNKEDLACTAALMILVGYAMIARALIKQLPLPVDQAATAPRKLATLQAP